MPLLAYRFGTDWARKYHGSRRACYGPFGRMTTSIAVCDAGVGNVRSVVRALERAAKEASISAEVMLTGDPARLDAADVVVVPGQGSFGTFARAMEGGIGDVLRARLTADRPYLGICLGLQVLFGASEEAPDAQGLGVFAGSVRRLAPGVDAATAKPAPLPHIGWNTATPVVGNAMGGAIPATHFYFAHSYAVVPDDDALVAATTTYGETTFPCAVSRGRVLGVQFHPEKSQSAGMTLLGKWLASMTTR